MPLTSSDYLEIWTRAADEPNGLAIGCNNSQRLEFELHRARPANMAGWHISRLASHPDEVWLLPPHIETQEPGVPPNDPPRRRNDFDLSDD